MLTGKIIRAGSVPMGLVFLFGAAVQYNDPDPVPWALVYIVAAALSFAGAYRGRLPWWLPAATAAGALAWAVVIAVSLDASVLGQMFSEFGMRSLEIEEAREALGLVIIGTWMSVVAVQGRGAP